MQTLTHHRFCSLTALASRLEHRLHKSCVPSVVETTARPQERVLARAGGAHPNSNELFFASSQKLVLVPAFAGNYLRYHQPCSERNGWQQAGSKFSLRDMKWVTRSLKAVNTRKLAAHGAEVRWGQHTISH